MKPQQPTGYSSHSRRSLRHAVALAALLPAAAVAGGPIDAIQTQAAMMLASLPGRVIEPATVLPAASLAVPTGAAEQAAWMLGGRPAPMHAAPSRSGADDLRGVDPQAQARRLFVPER